MGKKETTNYFIKRLLLQKNCYKGAMGATRAHTDPHYCETSVQKSRTEYDAEQAFEELQKSSNLLSTQIVVNPAAIAKASQESSNLLSPQIVVNPAAIAIALQESSNRGSTQIVGNPAAIAKALQGSSNLLSTQIVVNPAAIAKGLLESPNLLST